jgi:hypothetical protein
MQYTAGYESIGRNWSDERMKNAEPTDRTCEMSGGGCPIGRRRVTARMARRG